MVAKQALPKPLKRQCFQHVRRMEKFFEPISTHLSMLFWAGLGKNLFGKPHFFIHLTHCDLLIILS
jgi:hypothetical protein